MVFISTVVRAVKGFSAAKPTTKSKSGKKNVAKGPLEPSFKIEIRAQMATAAPPLGPELGQRGVNVANFCKDFNKRTTNIKPGTLLPVQVSVSPDRTYELEMFTPTGGWLLKQAAGIRREKQTPGEIVGKLSMKHIYEIAKFKSNDKVLVGVPLKEICLLLLKECDKIGIQVQNGDLDPVALKVFLDERREIVAAQLKEIEEREAAKMLRG